MNTNTHDYDRFWNWFCGIMIFKERNLRFQYVIFFSLNKSCMARFGFSVSHAKKREKDFVPAVAASKPTHTHIKSTKSCFFKTYRNIKIDHYLLYL